MRNEERAYPHMNEDVLHFATCSALTNWLEWRQDWEHSASGAAQLPILQCEARFRAFKRAYGLQPHPQIMAIRGCLIGHQANAFEAAVQDEAGQRLDTLIVKIHEDLNINLHRACITKLAAFARPDVFVACDKWARKGLARCRDVPVRDYAQGYAHYLCDLNQVWRGHIGNQIRETQCEIAECWPGVPVLRRRRANPAIGKRILDCCLMINGGRWNTQLGLDGPFLPQHT